MHPEILLHIIANDSARAEPLSPSLLLELWENISRGFRPGLHQLSEIAVISWAVRVISQSPQHGRTSTTVHLPSNLLQKGIDRLVCILSVG